MVTNSAAKGDVLLNSSYLGRHSFNIIIPSAVTGACSSLLARKPAIHISDKNQCQIESRFVKCIPVDSLLQEFQDYSFFPLQEAYMGRKIHLQLYKACLLAPERALPTIPLEVEGI